MLPGSLPTSDGIFAELTILWIFFRLSGVKQSLAFQVFIKRFAVPE